MLPTLGRLGRDGHHVLHLCMWPHHSLARLQDILAADTRLGRLQMYAAAVLRNLAHSTKTHSLLIQGGVVEPLVNIIRMVKVCPLLRWRSMAWRHVLLDLRMHVAW